MVTNPKKVVIDIFNTALKAVDPYQAVIVHSDLIRSIYTSGGFRNFIVLGFGKAACRMAAALEDSVGDLIDGGIIITKYGHIGDYRTKKMQIFEAGHPVPDGNGLAATKKALQSLEGLDKHTLVVNLVSGGGSALLVSPSEGIKFQDKQALIDALLLLGADIHELNCVRKKLSKVKGGRLAFAAYPARVVSLIVSDVIGDRLDTIASGPTVPDSTTYKDALAVLQKYSINPPKNIMDVLTKGALGEGSKSSNQLIKIFSKVENILISSNRIALESARQKAKEFGFNTQILTDCLAGEARKSAHWLAEKAIGVTETPTCLISGGETTVTVKGKGKGGRNMEFALAFALQIKDFENITLLSAGTDGTDGPTDAAGAIVDGNTVPKANKLSLKPMDYLMENNSYVFFDRVGGLFKTGPTGTNVMDIQIALIINNAKIALSARLNSVKGAS